MLDRLRQRTWERDVLVVLSVLALAFKLLFPPGFMPGTSLSQPLVLCSGQGPVPAAMPAMSMLGMDHGEHHAPDKMPKGAADHACPFAGLGTTPLTPDANGSLPIFVSIWSAPAPARPTLTAPGRGMAAPPPPSHAPPITRA